MQFSRASGVLLHATSLPEGRLGPGARAFVRWLARAGQTWWQVLPLGPPDETGSPYQARSAFAGSPALLEDPRARVSRAEREHFRERQRSWIGDWEGFGGSVDDQVRFEREWSALREDAASLGVRLLGDVPIYTGRGGADVAARPDLFRSGEVAGAPPDALGPDGQLWGNPLYDWPAHRREGFRWWRDRFRRTFELVDAARVDHFRGFVSYWAVPSAAASAREGRWRRGPGRELFDHVGSLPLIAENLGIITPPVERLRHELGLPGMHVLLYGLDGGRANPHRQSNHEENGVVYTSTHDTPTAREAGADPWALIRLALSSRARLSIVPAQDVLGLGVEGRMNRPGTIRGNWRWRLASDLAPALADRLREETEAAARTAPVGRGAA